MRLDLLQGLNAARAARRASVLVTEIASGAQRLALGGAFASDPLGDALDSALRAGKSGMIDVEGER